MPLLGRCLVKASLIYLVIGGGIGGLLLAEKVPWFDSANWRLLPLHIEFLLWGWVLQFALGVACWILPGRVSIRDRTKVGWFSFAALNLGLVLSFCAYFNLIGGIGRGDVWLAIVIIITRLGGVVGLVCYLWPRVGFVLTEDPSHVAVR